MSRDRSSEQLFARELDRLPLPAEDRWLPRRRDGESKAPIALLLAGGLLLASLVVATALGLRENESVGATPSPSRAPASPTVGATPATIHNARFGYAITLPAPWRPSEAAGIVLSETTLLSRDVYTAREPLAESRFIGSQFLPWELFVEVWERHGRSAEDAARTSFACGTDCTLSRQLIAGASAVVASHSKPIAGRVYLIERGDQLLVLRYAIGDASTRPPQVTEAVLELIISSLRLD